MSVSVSLFVCVSVCVSVCLCVCWHAEGLPEVTCVCLCVCQSVTPGRSREHTFEINIKAGWKAGTKLTYAGEGDEVQQGE